MEDVVEEGEHLKDLVDEGGDDMPQLEEMGEQVQHSSLEDMPELEEEGAVAVVYERRRKRV